MGKPSFSRGGFHGQVVRALSSKSKSLTSVSARSNLGPCHYVSKFASLLLKGQWSLPGYIVSEHSPPPIKTGRHQITEKLLSVAENNILLKNHWTRKVQIYMAASI
jgi:hypothetical protein